jgi:CPA2 family monovalent cation:H+ antiporter-2
MAGAFGAGLIGDLAIIMIASAIAIVVFRRLKQPVVLGYLIAGMVVGPRSGLLNLGIDPNQILDFADLGVIFLLLFIGMEFDLRQLRSIGAPAILIGSFEVGAMMGIGFVLGTAMGLDSVNSVYLGALIAISSTAVTLKILSELRLLEERATRLVIGILVIEDFAAVIILSSLSGTSGATLSPTGILGVIVLVIVFFFSTIFVGAQIVPWSFRRLESLGSEEVLTVAALGVCFGTALIAVLLGFSPAMGAFLAGVLIGESGVLDSIRPRFEPIRDLFAAIFFVSVGMLIIPAEFVGSIIPILIVTGVFLVGKVAATGGITFLLGYGGRDALAVGTRMARTGEFSFIIGNVGIKSGAMRPDLYAVIAGVTVITTFIGASLVRGTGSLYRAIAGLLPPTLDQAGASYTAWVSKARSSSRRDPVIRQKFRQNGVRIFLTTIFIIIVSWTAVALRGPAILLAQSTSSDPVLFEAALFGVAIALVVYPVVVMIRLGKELIELTVAAATEGSATGRVGGRAAVGKLVSSVIAIGIFALLAVGLIPLLVAASATSLPILALVLFFSFSFAGYRIFKSARALQERFENVFTEGLGEEPTSQSEGGPVVQKLSNLPRYLWAFGETETIAEYVVPEGSPLAGWALADLRIRGRTGARIVAVQHGSHLQTAPPPTTRIHEGDLLLLVGTLSDLERFEVLLGRSLEMEIQEASPA